MSNTFDKDNVFLLLGHGAEAIDKDLPRYVLGPNEYMASYSLPGDLGLVVDPNLYKEFYNTGKAIKIPAANEKYLVKPEYLGISDAHALKRVRLDIKYVLYTGLKQLIVKRAEQEVREDAAKMFSKFLTDVYREAATWPKKQQETISGVIKGNYSIKDKVVKILALLVEYDKLNIFGQSTINLLTNIVNTSTTLIYTKPERAKHIENWKLYHPRENNEEINYLNTAPNLIFSPGAVFHGAIFDSWLKTHSIKTNAGTFINTMPAMIKYKDVFYYNLINNLNVMTLLKSGITRTSQDEPVFKKTDIEDYDSAFEIIREGEVSLYGEILDPFDGINKHMVTIFYPNTCLNQTLGDVITNKYTDPLAYDFISWYKAAYNESILTFDDLCLYAIAKIGLHENKSRLHKFREFFTKHLPYELKKYKGTVSIFLSKSVQQLISGIKQVYSLINMFIIPPLISGKSVYEKYQKEGELFMDLKKTFTKDEIQALSLGLYIDEILDVAMSLDTVYKFINTYGKVEGKPFMVLPIICRFSYGPIGLMEDKRKMTRPDLGRTRSKTKSKSKTRKNHK